MRASYTLRKPTRYSPIGDADAGSQNGLGQELVRQTEAGAKGERIVFRVFAVATPWAAPFVNTGARQVAGLRVKRGGRGIRPTPILLFQIVLEVILQTVVERELARDFPAILSEERDGVTQMAAAGDVDVSVSLGPTGARVRKARGSAQRKLSGDARCRRRKIVPVVGKGFALAGEAFHHHFAPELVRVVVFHPRKAGDRWALCPTCRTASTLCGMIWVVLCQVIFVAS
jgi:hypothetical protein